MGRRGTCNELISTDQRESVIELYTMTYRTYQDISTQTGVPIDKIKMITDGMEREKRSRKLTDAEITSLLMGWGRKVKRTGMLATILLLVSCSHVQPYAAVGFGYASETGHYYTGSLSGAVVEVAETGCVNHTEIGLEFKAPWYLPDELRAHHRSQCRTDKPEIEANDVMLMWRVGGFRNSE